MGAPNKNYKSRAKNLRALGLLRKGVKVNSLSEADKRHIRRTESRLREQEPTLQVIQNPGNYKSFAVDKATAEKLADKYAVIKTRDGHRVFTYAKHAQKVKFNKRTGTVDFIHGNRTVRGYPGVHGAELFKTADKAFARGEKVGFRVGSDGPMFWSYVRNKKEMERYLNQLEEEWKARELHEDPDKRRDNPFDQIEIVAFKGRTVPWRRNTRKKGRA